MNSETNAVPKKPPVWIKTPDCNIYTHVSSGGKYLKAKVCGKPFCRSLGTKLQEVARRKAAELLASERKRRSKRPNDELTFGDLATTIEDETPNTDLTKSSKSYRFETLKSLWATWPELKENRPRNIQPKDCRDWATRARARYNPTRFNGMLTRLRELIRLAIELGLIIDDTTRKIKWASVPLVAPKLPTQEQFLKFLACLDGRPKRITRDELYQQVWSEPTWILAPKLGVSGKAIQKLCERLDVPKPEQGYWNLVRAGYQMEKPPLPLSAEKYGWIGGRRIHAANFVRVMIFTGARIGSVRKMRVGDIDFANNVVLVPPIKYNDAPVRVPIFPEAKPFFQELIANHVGGDSPLVPIKNPRRAIASACKEAGIPKLTPHNFRHWCASIVAQTTKDPKFLGAVLGHKDGGVLAMKRYAHCFDEHAQAQAKKVRFFETKDCPKPHADLPVD